PIPGLRLYHDLRLPLRVAIELLTCRVDQLCQFIQENGLQPPRMSHYNGEILQTILETLGIGEQGIGTIPYSDNISGNTLPSTNDDQYTFLDATMATSTDSVEDTENRNPCPEQSTELPITVQCDHFPDSCLSQVPNQNDYSNIDMACEQSLLTADSPGSVSSPWLFDLHFGTNTALSPKFKEQQQTDMPPTIFSAPAEFPQSDTSSNPSIEPTDTFDIEALVDEISDRIGTIKIGNGGKTRFYGPTSTFNLREIPFLDNYEDKYSIIGDQLETDEGIPAALENHLLDLYFSWQDPSFHIVDRSIYEEAKQKWSNHEETPFYSDALRNAMCALGSAFECRYHPTFITFPKTLVEFFGDRAKSILEVELDSPCVATIQALVILSSHEIGNGKDARGWLYSGSALRLAFDLGLHLDMSSHVSAGIISAPDADLRRTVFWTAYVVDQQLGFHLGRPFRTNMEDVTVGKPCEDSGSMSNCRWTPFDSSSMNPDSGLLDSKDAISQRLVSLCDLMAPCGYILYGTSNIPKETLQELNAKIVAELRRWKSTLPPSLQINFDDVTSPYLPHVLILHMQYHQNIIYAHRPWISKSHLQPQPPKGPGYTHAREMCIESAVAISKILTMYESRYTLRRINVQAVSITSSAILFLLFAIFSNCSSYSRTEISVHLTTCFRALDEFALCWKSAHRARDLLVGLQHQWDLRTRAKDPSNRSDDIFYIPRKRSKTAGGNHTFVPASQDNQASQIDFDLGCMLDGADASGYP
ncbi:hypothetical protein N7456_005957, partial [Penicillium angulare]